MQQQLFGTSHQKPDSVGAATVNYYAASQILTPGKGFMSAYDFTLNPYSGCTFGCRYCYAAFFARSQEKVDAWGTWVLIKENAIQLLRKKRRGSLDGKSLYLSSVTDPYQPVERSLELTRGLLQVLSERHDVRLVVQTRSPLVERDVDIFRRFSSVQINITVTTDDDGIRRAFEPACPNNKVRLRAASNLSAAGLPVMITMTPLLPVTDPDTFADTLLATGAKQFVVQPFHATGGQFVAGTRSAALEESMQIGWTPDDYERTVERLKVRLPNLVEGQAGFRPPL